MLSNFAMWNPFRRATPPSDGASTAHGEVGPRTDSVSTTESFFETTSTHDSDQSRTDSPEDALESTAVSELQHGLRSPHSNSAQDRATAKPPRPPPTRGQSTFAPAVPSPLNPSPPPSPESKRLSGTGTGIARPNASLALPRSHSAMTINSIYSSRPMPSARSLRLDAYHVPRPPVLRAERSSPSLRPHTPMSVSELGRDYSRYPTPKPSRSPSTEPPRMTPNAHAGHGFVPPASSRPISLLPSTSSLSLPEKGDAEKAFVGSLLDDRVAGPAPYLGGYPMPMFTHEKEADDDLHMPQQDDDLKFKPRARDYLRRDCIIPFVGGAVMICGLLGLFIVLPVLTYAGVTAPRSTRRPWEAWEYVTDETFPLLKNLRTGLIDPDTPKSAMTRRSVDGGELQLVFSDEFNTEGRTFYPGDDPYFTAPDIWYGATRDLEWYDPDAANTEDGTLNIRLDRFPNHGLLYRSGMLNSWNQLCFKGGAFEVSISLPGPAGVPGLWPGVWTMGNLGRPGYLATTEGVWPYTYDECDMGITPNQSASDGLSWLPGQKLSSCTCAGEDHPSPGVGRGAPEIDVIEAAVDPKNGIGVVTQSYQVAPYDIWQQPNYDFMEIPYYETTQVTPWTGGPFQQAVSGTTLLNNGWYDGELYQKFGFEYTPGADRGQISWFVGDRVTVKMLGKALGPNGNVKQRVVAEEPMTIVLNLGISEGWSFIDWPRLAFPTTMRVDYVRWYQKPGEVMVTCDPPGYPTTEYIAKHIKAYTNPNLTRWDQTGYGWPKHELNSDC